MPTYCKTWFYPEDEHRPLCKEEYRPLESNECPVCVTPFVPQPGCSNLPLGSQFPTAHCDYVPQNNPPLQYVRNFPRWLRVTITPGARDSDVGTWPCVSTYYRGEFLCYNSSLCGGTWYSLGKGPVCTQIVNGQTVCVDNGSGSYSGWRVTVDLNYDRQSRPPRQSFIVRLYSIPFACGSQRSQSAVFKTDDTFSDNGWRFDCKATHKIKWFRSTNSVGQPIWVPLDSPTVIPNPGFSITITPV